MRPKGAKVGIMRVIAPLSVFLLNGVGLKIDQTDIGRNAFFRCFPSGCLSDAAIDDIDGLPPTIAIEQRSGGHSPRSIVAPSMRWNGKLTARHIANLSGVVHNLIVRHERKAPCHEFHYRAESQHGGSDA